MVDDHPFILQARRDLEKAEASRTQAESLLRAAELEIYQLKIFIDRYQNYSGDAERPNNIGRMKIRSRTISDFAVSIIENSENPLHIQEILEGLSRSGIEVGGENKAANLAAYLSKDNRVRFERGVGWMISGDRLSPEDRGKSQHSSLAASEVLSAKGGSTRLPHQLPRNATFTNHRRTTSNEELDDDIPF